MKYDMSDIKVRAMVEAQHSPREFRVSNHTGLLAQTIECMFCHEAWPCDARRQLLAWHEASATPRDDEIKIAGRFVDAASGKEWPDADAE